MVKLRYKNNTSVIIDIIGPRNTFYQCLNIIKTLPVRNYDRSKKEWSMPVSDIIILKNKCNQSVINFEVEEKVKIAYREYLEWRHSQLEIKENDKCDDWDVLKFPLRPFQTVGAEFLYQAGDALLLDHVGLGKTIQAMAVAEKKLRKVEVNFVIIICPSTLKKNWLKEIEKFTNRSAFIINGDKSKRKKLYKKAYEYDYLIINYDLLHWDIDFIDEYILEKGYEFLLIADEVQFIKNHTAKRSKITKQISAQAVNTIGLSATVLENKILDLWSVFHIVNDDIYGNESSYYTFCQNFVNMDFWGNPVGYRKTKLLRSKMSPYTIRRFKEDVLDQLPDRIENTIWIDLNSEQRKLYNEVAHNIITNIEDMEKAERIQMADILPMMTYLRQCVLSPYLVGGSKTSTKIDALLEFLESMDGDHKLVIFTHFIGMVELLYEKLTNANYKVMAMHGGDKKTFGVGVDDRVDMINEFNQSKELQILVTSDILNTGVNITSASYLINMDLLFNPAKMEQRIGRIDRIGNVNKVINIINILANDSIEENVWDIYDSKVNMSREIIDNNKVEKRITSTSVIMPKMDIKAIKTLVSKK